jgi:phenylacetate-CoA ligase
MRSPRRTPLDAWAAAKLGLAAPRDLNRERLDAYRLQRLKDLAAHLRERSPYYRGRLAGIPAAAIQAPEDLQRLPLTPAEDLRQDPLSFLCASRDAIARVVTLRTSGTTGPAKRLYFDDSDLAATVDFFHWGMATLTAPGQRVLILLPGGAPGGVTDLLRQALDRLGAAGEELEAPPTPARILAALRRRQPACLVGSPVQVLGLARSSQAGRIPWGTIHSVLLTTDYVPRAVVEVIRRTWGADVFQHYGMTEMGYGGGVECEAFSGYHLREADLWFEIVDPLTGRTIDDDREGEVVFTTLTRRAMPLLRYRTGDLARWVHGPCPCGSSLRRLGRVRGRLGAAVPLGPTLRLSLADLDEAIFPVEGVVDFQAAVHRRPDGDHLRLTLYVPEVPARDTLPEATAALRRVPVLAAALEAGMVTLDPVCVDAAAGAQPARAKRHIRDCRERRVAHAPIG